MKQVTLYEVTTKEIMVEDLRTYVVYYQRPIERNQFNYKEILTGG